MSVIVVIDGQSFTYPTEADEDWGEQASLWAVAVSTKLLQRSGGTFTLSNEVDFGGSFGLKSLYLKSRGTNPATAGIIRLANLEGINWRNAANSGNLPLSVNASDEITFNGVPLAMAPGGILTVADGGTGFGSYTIGDMLYASGAAALSKLGIGSASRVLTSSGSAPQWALLVNANIDAAAAIALSKLAATTGERVMVSNSSGVITPLTAAVSDGMLVKSVSGVPAFAYPYSRVSKTTTYTVAASDTHVDCDATGGGFTVTVPAAASGNAGQTVWIRKTDSSFNAVTLATGVSTTLNTSGECVQIQSDGSAWAIIQRTIPSTWTSYTPTFSAGFGTVTSISAAWMRQGNRIVCRGTAAAGTVTASYMGITIPSGLAHAYPTATIEIGGFTSSYTGFSGGTIPLINPARTTEASWSNNTARNGLAELNGSTAMINTSDFSWIFEMTISGWNG